MTITLPTSSGRQVGPRPIGLEERTRSQVYHHRVTLLSRSGAGTGGLWAGITIEIWVPNLYPAAYFNGSIRTAVVRVLGLGEDWFMHMGSVALGQPGSLTLGGYEENRILGQAAAFFIDTELPRVFLVDVLLDFETEESPYNTTVGSVWQNVNLPDTARSVVKQFGGASGSAMVLPNAAVSYLYLPPEVCEAAASHLPVRRVSEIGLYVWDFQGDPIGTARFVNSPAYMAFVFSDEVSRNLTIKIPFKLLNLTIDRIPSRESAVNWELDSYWPCKPWTAADLDASLSQGRYQLGRAFLQGTFTGFNYYRRWFYMAQAPGPGMAQRIIVKDDVWDSRSRSADTFADTWRASWTEVQLETERPSGIPLDAIGFNSTSTGRLGTGAIAGIAVGAGCSLVATVAALWFFCWRARRKRDDDDVGGDRGRGVHDVYVFTGGKAEIDGEGMPMSGLAHRGPKSALGGQEPQELPKPFTSLMNGSPGPIRMVFELPGADMVSHEKGGGDKRPISV
ncbi:hypothetical protein CORC01_10490 [Colletotrichum orchidophilum]|uniref:Peptidase A1 domain-containing protein n=1 Tax=Colletotrichum orchidophilum TaxID=1209926 RepID=A0A1G4AYN6_9PEZI|nr:uncharacterized protein CORC01_10490 [Colletotrichum orchidophilum]OHE94152.1 hypothetical protein CORC01_10490 [Colletotrichum orchidophilum]